MGIKNAPATFQRLMDTVLKGMHGTEVFVYLDDIVVYAESLKDFSKTINTCEQRHPEAKKECLAVLYAVMNFRPYPYPYLYLYQRRKKGNYCRPEAIDNKRQTHSHQVRYIQTN